MLLDRLIQILSSKMAIGTAIPAIPAIPAITAIATAPNSGAPIEATTTPSKLPLSPTAPPPTIHHAYMQSALRIATSALQNNEVPVGCVFVHDSRIIASGRNDTNRSLCGTRHAELVAIDKILATHPPSIFKETDLYVTVEPCIMCASALSQVGIRKVYFGCSNDRFGGCGGVLRVHEGDKVNGGGGYEVVGGIYSSSAVVKLREFYVQENGRAPVATNKKGRELKTDNLPVDVVIL